MKNKKSESESSQYNFYYQLIANGLTKLGDALVDVKTVLPWVMQSLGVPVLLVSALVPLRESGSLLPQRWWTGWVKRQPQRKRVWIYGAIGQCIAVASMAWVVSVMSGVWAGVCLLLLVSLFSLARSLCSISAKDVMGRTISKTRRGQLTGWSVSIAGVLTLFVGLLMWSQGQPQAWVYSLLLLIASVLWLLATAVYGRIDEPGSVEDSHSRSVTPLHLLWRKPTFGWFILIRSLLLSTTLVAPFYTLLIQQSAPQLSQLGLLMVASSTAAILAGPLLGRLADWSSRRVLMLSGILVGSTGLMLVIADCYWRDTPMWLLTAFFFLLMFSYQGVRIARKTYVVDMASGDQRTDYVALGNTVIGVMLLLCSLFGLVAQMFTVVAAIAVLSVVSLVAGLLVLRLPEVEVLAED